MLLRLFAVSARYIYIFLNIMATVFPFLILMLITMIGFAHAMLVRNFLFLIFHVLKNFSYEELTKFLAITHQICYSCLPKFNKFKTERRYLFVYRSQHK